MIFVKNPELGKVKTRLAKTIGAERALRVYKKLLAQTNRIANNVNADKAVFYSEYADDFDMWDDHVFQKYVQQGNNLGERMYNAFKRAFGKGYKHVCIIGSDCYELKSWNIEEAFYMLEMKNAVIGPSEDGGYYLLGLNTLDEKFFVNKKWSTEDVFLDTLLDIQKLKLSYSLLETLSDVDYEEDLGELKKLIE